MYHNPEKVTATFIDLLDRGIIEAEIELEVNEFSTKEKAYEWVGNQIVEWVYEFGNLRFCTFLEPLMWDVFEETQ